MNTQNCKHPPPRPPISTRYANIIRTDAAKQATFCNTLPATKGNVNTETQHLTPNLLQIITCAAIVTMRPPLHLHKGYHRLSNPTIRSKKTCDHSFPLQFVSKLGLPTSIRLYYATTYEQSVSPI